MHMTNHTPYSVAYNPGLLPSGRYCLIVVVKATYDLPLDQPVVNALPLAAKQQPLVEADSFTGEPGYSSPYQENDFATHKPQCDVLIHATAHSPRQQPVTRLSVTAQVGIMNKTFEVVGKRHWEKHWSGLCPSEPQAFTEKRLNWEMAYGGEDRHRDPEGKLTDSYLPNPIGTGYWQQPHKEHTPGSALAETETPGQPMTSPKERHTPQGFGPIGRNWQPRSGYGGTYDDAWQKHDKPFLPNDFDERYYQCAPPDQQIPYPQGNERVLLRNLTPLGEFQCPLPTLAVPVTVKLANGETQTLPSHVDTLTIDTHTRQLTLVARARYDLKNTLHEVAEVIVGHPMPDTPQDPKDNA